MYKVKTPLILIVPQILTILLLVCAGIPARAQADSLLPARELSVRKGLPNFYAKVKAGEKLNVAFLGGSITRAGGGYRDQVMNWFREEYPAARFEEIMAAVSGTGSDFGACRVQKHVVDHLPDLVFVEFAVNDNGMKMKFIRETVEGIVRQVWVANPSTDICFIYTFSKENIPALQQGLFPPSVTAMEAVAKHYNIPSIHMGLAVLKELDSKRMIMVGKRGEESALPVFSYDGVHPLPETGHRIYTQVLEKGFKSMEAGAKRQEHDLPVVMEAGNWSDAGMLGFGKKTRFKGQWGITDSVTRGKEFYSLLPAVHATSSPGACLIVRFKGTRFGLADIMGPGSANIEVTIDHQPPRIIPRFDAYCTWYRLNYFILSDLPPGKHKARVRLAPGPIDKAAVLRQRNAVVKDWAPYSGKAMFVGAILY